MEKGAALLSGNAQTNRRLMLGQRRRRWPNIESKLRQLMIYAEKPVPGNWW